MKKLILIPLGLIVIMVVALTPFIYKYLPQLQFILSHPRLFTEDSRNKSGGATLLPLISKAEVDPYYFATLKNHMEPLRRAVHISGNTAEMMLKYEAEEKLVANCRQQSAECEDYNWVLGLAQEDPNELKKLTLMAWVSTRNYQPYTLSHIRDATKCRAVQSDMPFGECLRLIKLVIRYASLGDQESQAVAYPAIHDYAVYRSLAEERYSFEEYESVVMNLYEDAAMKNIILDDNYNLVTASALSDEVIDVLIEDASNFRLALTFADENPFVEQIVSYLY